MSENAVVEGDPLGVGAQPQRKALAGLDPPPTLGGREIAAGPGVGALGQRAVGCRGGLADLGASAEARVQPTGRVQPAEGVVVEPGAPGLAHGRLVPVDPECA